MAGAAGEVGAVPEGAVSAAGPSGEAAALLEAALPHTNELVAKKCVVLFVRLLPYLCLWRLF